MRILIACLGLMAFSVADTEAQFPLPRTPPIRPDSASLADTIPVPPFRFQPPISPFGAFARSMLVPGWGQSILGRRVTGAVLVFWEGLSLTMTLKSVHQLNYLESIDDGSVDLQERIESKRQEIQDWVALLVFNHLIAGAEAFVSAQLWDFPVELETRVLPGGRAGLSLRVPLPARMP